MFNFYVLFLVALVPLIIGFVWYGPLFGKAWMKEMGFTEESLKEKSMMKAYIISYVLGILIAMFLLPVTIHQMGVHSVLSEEPGFAEKTGEAYATFLDFMQNYGGNFRTFKHGALHGTLSAVFLLMPVLTVGALFEGKSVKYIAINVGYWVVSLAIMGGLICRYGLKMAMPMMTG